MLYVSEKKAKRKNTLSGLLKPLSVFRKFSEIDQRDERSYETPAQNSQVFSGDSEFSVVGCEDQYRELVALKNSGTIIRKRLFHVAEQIALEAIEYGAREVYIGHPREYRYEFFVDDRGYQGSIDPSDYFGLLKLFGDDPDISVDVDWADVEALNLSLTSNYLNPVVHLSWRMRWLDTSVMETEYDHFQQ